VVKKTTRGKRPSRSAAGSRKASKSEPTLEAPPLSFGFGIRVPMELKQRIDAFARKLRGERRGARVSRGEAARVLIEMGLEAEEKASERES
jgi:hypothetical protein